MENGVKRIIERAEKDEEVLAVILFGSSVRENKASGDIDVCLMLKPKKTNKLLMSNKKIEYSSLVTSKYDVQIFQQLPSFVRVSILKEGKFLLNKNYDEVLKIALDSIKEFDLFKKHYLYCIRSIAYGG